MDQRVDDGDFVRLPSGQINKDFDFGETELPSAVVDAPGMLSKGERQLLYGLSKTYFTGAGAIIDGGSFFGSSIVSSAQGLRDNPRIKEVKRERFPDGRIIHGYELGFLPAPKLASSLLRAIRGFFTGDPSPLTKPRNFGGVDYELGTSFVPVLEESTAPYADLVELHIGDFNEESWPEVPIEICFIDVCKTPSLNAHVSRQFFPHLIPGRSILINQDFFFDRLPWIKVTMGYLAEYFEWIGQVHSSSVYLCKKAIPADVIGYDPFAEASTEDCLNYHQESYRSEALSDGHLLRMDLSYAYLLAARNQRNEALALLENCQAKYADFILESAEHFRQLADGAPDTVIRDAQFRLDRARRQIETGLIKRLS